MKRIFIAGILIGWAYMAIAQPGGGGPTTPPVPISGIEILLGAGALLGARRLYNLRKPKP
jgi:hypothetical protein